MSETTTPADFPTGATRLYIIVGDPIAQVKSPAGMTQAFRARGHNAILVPMHVTPADLAPLIAGAKLVNNLDGIVVTIPHKFAMAAQCTSLSTRAQFLGATNIIRRTPEGGWHGDMLDGLGFVAAIRAKGGEPAGKRALLAGAGGAGSAIALALVDAGVTSLAIHDADAARGDALISRLRAYSATPISIGSSDPTGFDLAANATPAGMRAGDAFPVDAAKLAPAAFAACVITQPVPAPWLAAAAARGCATSDGVDMYKAEQAMMLEFLLGSAS
jgi:shikimate dehydrogenase